MQMNSYNSILSNLTSNIDVNENENNTILTILGSLYLNNIRSSPNILLLFINSIVENIPINQVSLISLLIEYSLYGFCNVYIYIYIIY